jgi:hypothetical protein
VPVLSCLTKINNAFKKTDTSFVYLFTLYLFRRK